MDDFKQSFHGTFAKAYSKSRVVGETGWGQGNADDDKQY